MTRRNLLVPMLLLVAIALAAVLGAVASNTSPVLGLDLQGGFSVVLQAKEVNGRLPSEENVEKAKDIIRQRVDGLGVAEPDITRQGRTVIVQLPGVRNRAKAESLVGCTAKLEFRPVLTRAANPDALPATTTTKPKSKGKGSKSTTTTKPKGSKSTTTTKPKGTTTTKPKSTTTTSPDGDGENGAGSAGIAPGEGALPRQFAPTTTTTTPPTTTVPVTTAPASTTTVAASTTQGDTTSTTAAAGTGSSGCGSDATKSTSKGTASTTTSSLPDGQAIFPDQDGQVLYTLGPVGFTGDALSSAKASLAQNGGWEVLVNVKGAQKAKANAAFNACYQGAATCPGQQGSGAIAIVLDGEVISAPTVQAQDLADKQFTITGDFSEGEAKDLALVLRYGSLPVEFEQAALQQVSATLGKDSLRAGLIAGAIGIAAVGLYMILYYRGLGLVVLAGLTIWGGLMYGLVCWLGQSQGLALTLSGITGIIVSVGTTVDSYVVYFERIKDEVRAGKSIRAATERGFHSAIRTILTADVSSFIGAFLLWYLTVGPVRGFAFFLGISVLLDLLVAYFFTRPLVIFLGRSKWFTNARFLGLASALDRAPLASGATA